MATAKARHILVQTLKECEDLLKKIKGGEDFAELAKKYSKCPSGKQGGFLGEFSQGDMVKEFDEVVFKKEINAVHGPIKTQFGYHLLEIMERND